VRGIVLAVFLIFWGSVFGRATGFRASRIAADIFRIAALSGCQPVELQILLLLEKQRQSAEAARAASVWFRIYAADLSKPRRPDPSTHGPRD